MSSFRFDDHQACVGNKVPPIPSVQSQAYISKDLPPGVPPRGLTFDKHLIVKAAVRSVGLNRRLLAALKQSSQKLSFSRSMAYETWGNQMFLNVSQLSQR